MKIRVTEIEASAEELKASQDLSSAFTNAFRTAFVGRPRVTVDEEDMDESEDE